MTKKPAKPIKIKSPKDAALYVDELHTLRKAIRVSDERAASVAAGLDAWLTEQRETEIVVEGLPRLALRESSGYDYDLAAMADRDLETLLEYARAGVLTVVAARLREAVTKGTVTRSARAFRTPSRGRRELRFDQERRD